MSKGTPERVAEYIDALVKKGHTEKEAVAKVEAMLERGLL